MRITFVIFSFLFGSAVGSFLNVIAHRVPRGESIVRPGSRCTSCGRSIRWFDNVPVISWFVLGGKCRYCGSSFSIRYAVVELVTGLVFAGLFLRFGADWLTLKYAVFASLLICTVLTDLDHWLVLDSVSLGGIAAGLLFTLLPGTGSMLPHLISAAGSFLLFLMIRTISSFVLRGKPGYTIAPEGHEDEEEEFQGGMGWGDVKLAAMIGAFLGPSLTAVALFLAFLSGALTGIAVMLRGRSKRIPLPFGPFMALGSMLSVFAGTQLWNMYIQLGISI